MTKRKGAKRARLAAARVENEAIRWTGRTSTRAVGPPRAPSQRTKPTEAGLQLLLQHGIIASWAESAELQCVSLALCETCRRYVPARVLVAKKTPRSVWARNEGGVLADTRERAAIRSGDGHGARLRGRGRGRRKRRGDRPGDDVTPGSARRFPPLRISSIAWEAPAKDLGDGSALPAELRELTFGRAFNGALGGFKWPSGLKRLTFGSKFNRDVATAKEAGTGEERSSGSNLPDSLEELTFGKHFNKPLPPKLPADLVTLTFGRNFCRLLHTVVWPARIRIVEFGPAMLASKGGVETLLAVAWPDSLSSLQFNKS